MAGGSPPPTPAYSLSSSIGAPQSIVTDSSGNAYFTSLNCVFKLYTNGALLLVAGNSKAGYSGDGGLAVNAQLWAPVGLAIDASNDIFIADSGNNRVREIGPNGVITTAAGNGTASFSGDGGPASSAGLSGVTGVGVDASGNLYIADSGNNRVRKVTPKGIISTLAGNGNSAVSGDGGPAASAQLSATSIVLDPAGDIFIGDAANYRVREISTSGIITTLAGAGTPGYSGDGGSARGAQLSTFHEMAVDPLGNLYIADSGNSVIREVTTAGIISTVAGIGSSAFFGDQGSPTSAALSFPFGITLDSSGDLFIADTSNYRVREVFTNNIIATVAGNGASSYSGDGGGAVSAQISGPEGISTDRFGNLYFADTSNNVVREIQTNGVINTVAGNGALGYSGDNGTATSAELSGPQGLAVDASGDLFIGDTGNYRVREVAGGIISTLAGSGNSIFNGDGGMATSATLSAVGVAVDALGDVFIGDPVNFRVREVLPNGNIATVAGIGTKGYSGDSGPALSAQLSAVAGLAVDNAGDIYIADSGNNCIRKVSAAGTITTIAGNGTAGFSGDGGPAASAQLRNPSGVTVDSAGNLYIADTGNNRVRKVSTAGVISTIAGNGSSGYSGDGGAGNGASLSLPYGVAVVKSGNVYVSDTGNNAIRLLALSSQSVLISAVVDAASESAAFPSHRARLWLSTERVLAHPNSL